MIENNNRIKPKNNLHNNLNNHISKPSFLMTVNPDKFLQKSNYKSAMSIKDRDEMNPEMAEIVKKILMKRKKEKKNNKHNNSMIKSKKVNSINKFFDEKYNKKHGFNKENFYKINKSLIFDSLNNRMGLDHVRYFDYIKRSNLGNKSAQRNKKNINCNFSFSRNGKNIVMNFGNLRTSKNYMGNFSSVNKPLKYSNNNDNEFKFNKKLKKSLNLREDDEEFSPKNVKNIKIIKNNQYILNLNSITIDVEQINKDKNIMEINCSNLDDNIINLKLSPQKDNNPKKNHIYIKRTVNNNDRVYLNNITKETPTTKNFTQNDIRLSEKKNNKSNKNYKILDTNKNNILNKFKMRNKSKEIAKERYNKLALNRSLEHRNKYNINKKENEKQFNMTMSNGFYKGNSFNLRNINNNLSNKEIKKLRPSNNKRINLNINKKEIKKDVLNPSFIKREYKHKISRESEGKTLNKSIKNKKNNINKIKNTQNILYNTQIHNPKFKPSPTRSKNESNLSTERSINYKKIKKYININKNNINSNDYVQNRSLSKDHFQIESIKKLTFSNSKIENNNSTNHETLRIDSSNKNSIFRGNLFRNKVYENEKGKENSNANTQTNNSNSNSQRSNSIKKEYPNMAKFIYGRKQIIDIIDEEEIKSSKNKETKLIKKMENLCKKGYSGPGIKKTNQDNFFIYNNFNNNSNYIYLGVCDGHGLFGQDISGYLVNNLPQNMNNNVVNKGIKNLSTEKISVLSKIFQETFIQTNSSLNEDERIDSSFSGSTCVSLLFTPTRICCINVGDSRCIIGKFNGYEWKSKPLSRDHKPSEPDEMNRIIKSGGRVESFRDNFGNFVGPERVWNKQGDGPGLAMSRSFGDEIGHKVGIVVDPEIMEHYFLKEDKFIILGSDGIWEFISNEEVVEIVKDYYLQNNIEGAIDHLYNEASKRWIMDQEVIDDITIIVIFLN